jgi:bifunctional non-homologous end joining protein LigD
MTERVAKTETAAGVPLTNLDEPLFDKAGATKRDLVDYLDAVADRIIPELRDPPLSVIRVRPGQQPFMQKNVPKYTPEWVPTVRLWAETSGREVAYALCNDRRTLMWFANQRAVEYHPTLVRAEKWDHPTYLVLDLDPALATTAYLREDRGGKVYVDSTRSGGATVVTAYSPRIRAGAPVSFPVAWDDLERVAPGDFTIHTALRLLAGADPWADHMPEPQPLGRDLIDEGRTIPVARVQAMHEGKRRARARRASS